MTTRQPDTLEVHGRSCSSTEICPACGQPSVLIALGVRYERPHRWRPWVTRNAPLALCATCDAVVGTARPVRPLPQVVSGPLRPAARRPTAPPSARVSSSPSQVVSKEVSVALAPGTPRPATALVRWPR